MTAYIISVHILVYKQKSVKNPLELELQGVCLELSPGWHKRVMTQVQGGCWSCPPCFLSVKGSKGKRKGGEGIELSCELSLVCHRPNQCWLNGRRKHTMGFRLEGHSLTSKNWQTPSKNIHLPCFLLLYHPRPNVENFLCANVTFTFTNIHTL